MEINNKTLNTHSGHRKRVFDKVKNNGFSSFHDYELLEFMLFFAETRKDTKDMAKALIHNFGSLKGVMEASREEIRSCGFSDRLASVLESYRECFYRYNLELCKNNEKLDSIPLVKNYIINLCLGKKEEYAYCVYLDSAKKILGTDKISEGGVSATEIYVEKIIRKAVLKEAKYIVLGHNHPSGNINPSYNDIMLLDELAKGLRAVRIFVYDFVICNNYDAFSCCENEIIKDNEIHSLLVSNNDNR